MERKPLQGVPARRDMSWCAGRSCRLGEGCDTVSPMGAVLVSVLPTRENFSQIDYWYPKGVLVEFMNSPRGLRATW